MINTTINKSARHNQTHWRDWLIIGVLIVLNSLIMLSSSSVMDTARDVYWAWQIATGTSFPLEGSLLGSAIHSGPIWFYVLAIPLLFSKSWVAVSLWVGFLSGLKYALAYACGSRLGSRKFGLIWACLLALPNWTAVNYLMFTHINLVETLVLLSIYSLIRWQQGEKYWFLIMCISLGLGIHAHASVYALAVAFVPVVAVSVYRKELGWRYVTGGALLAAAPLIPYLFSQYSRDWPDFQTTRSYLESQSILHNLLGYFDVLRGALVDGPLIAIRHVLALQGFPLWLAYCTLCLILVPGFFMAIYALARKKHQGPAGLLLISTLIIVASVTLIRPFTPFYMILVIYPTAYGFIAWGWSSLRFPPNWPLKGLFATISFVFLFSFLFKTIELGRVGHMQQSGAAAYNVRSHAVNEVTDSLYFPAWARKQFGSFICAQEKPVFFHGTTSLLLEQSYGLEAQMRCNTDAVYIGGKGTGRHYIGISDWDATQLGIKKRADTIGPISLEAVTRVIEPDKPEPLPDGELYPHRKFIYAQDQEFTTEFVAAAGEMIAITNLYHYWMPSAFWVALNGHRVEPLFETTQTAYFGCSGCKDGKLQQWQVTITAAQPELVEVVMFRPVKLTSP